MFESHLISKDEDRETATQFYRDLYHISGYRKIIDGSVCYRKALLATCGVKSDDCGFCSLCSTTNAIHQAANTVKQQLRREQTHREYCIEKLEEMKTRCLVCRSSLCGGLACLPDYKTKRCWKCHGYTTKATNFHYKIHCEAHKVVRGMVCPFCFLPFTPDVPASAKREDHTENKCLYKDRIRRVLLYSVVEQRDKGMSARKLLEPCITNINIWFETFRKALRLIKVDEQITNNDNI